MAAKNENSKVIKKKEEPIKVPESEINFEEFGSKQNAPPLNFDDFGPPKEE